MSVCLSEHFSTTRVFYRNTFREANRELFDEKAKPLERVGVRVFEKRQRFFFCIAPICVVTGGGGGHAVE